MWSQCILPESKLRIAQLQQKPNYTLYEAGKFLALSSGPQGIKIVPCITLDLSYLGDIAEVKKKIRLGNM